MERTWISKTGLSLCAIYLIFAAAMLIAGSTADPKGAYVLGQIACLPVFLLITAFGLDQFVAGQPWLNNYTTLIVLSLVILYGLGWVIGAVTSGSRRG
ncbi:MAG TPA: hypothetical protein VGC77_11440 [Rhodopseudomonas sp.]|uniref:hypothetical protein n=1 Tax=Rhodopseudomonas sp. TaxID=1078 RepID=UPI002ED8138C